MRTSHSQSTALIGLLFLAVVAVCTQLVTRATAEDKIEVVSGLGHAAQVNEVALSPDGRTALSASDDKTLKL